eukprot:1946883-Prymnesium_polylepis.1
MSPASAEGPSHILRYPSSWRGNQKPEAIPSPPPQKNPLEAGGQRARAGCPRRMALPDGAVADTLARAAGWPR